MGDWIHCDFWIGWREFVQIIYKDITISFSKGEKETFEIWAVILNFNKDSDLLLMLVNLNFPSLFSFYS